MARSSRLPSDPGPTGITMVQLKYFGAGGDHFKYDLMSSILEDMKVETYVFIPMFINNTLKRTSIGINRCICPRAMVCLRMSCRLRLATHEIPIRGNLRGALRLAIEKIVMPEGCADILPDVVVAPGLEHEFVDGADVNGIGNRIEVGVSR